MKIYEANEPGKPQWPSEDEVVNFLKDHANIQIKKFIDTKKLEGIEFIKSHISRSLIEFYFYVTVNYLENKPRRKLTVCVDPKIIDLGRYSYYLTPIDKAVNLPTDDPAKWESSTILRILYIIHKAYIIIVREGPRPAIAKAIDADEDLGFDYEYDSGKFVLSYDDDLWS